MRYSIIDDKIARTLRASFVNTYVDSSTDHYHKYLESPSKFEDGMLYDGYLWDCLKDNSQWEHGCSMNRALAYFAQKEYVYVMWDLFSNKRVHDGRQFSIDYPKTTIINLNGEELAKQLNYEWSADWNASGLLFPEDIYCFDSKMNWCVVLTHETTDGEDDNVNNRLCFLYTK